MTSDMRRHAIRAAQALIDARPVFLDTETTDLGPTAEIVEICILEHDGRPLVDTLVKPTSRITPGAQAVHHITAAMVARAPSWADIWPEVQAALEGRRVAIYNAPFDVQMMQQSHARHRLRWQSPAEDFVCLMRLYAQYHVSGRWQTLEAAARQCRLPIPATHRARADAELTRAVLQALAARPAR